MASASFVRSNFNYLKFDETSRRSSHQGKRRSNQRAAAPQVVHMRVIDNDG